MGCKLLAGKIWKGEAIDHHFDIEQKTKHTQLNAACLSGTAKRKLSPCVTIKHACAREKKELLYGLKLDKTYQLMLIKQRTSLRMLFPRRSHGGGVQV